MEAAGVEPASGIVLHGEPTYLVRSKVSTGSSERTRLNRSSPIVCQPCAPDRSLGPIPPDDALRPNAGLWTRAAAGSGSVCERRIVGSCCFSDRFTGARNPVCLSTTDAIPSNPLRPHTRIRGEENVLFCLHCNGAVERDFDLSADGAAPARACNGRTAYLGFGVTKHETRITAFILFQTPSQRCASPGGSPSRSRMRLTL